MFLSIQPVRLNKRESILNDAEAKVLFVNDTQQYLMACELQDALPNIESVIVFDDSVELKERPNHWHLDVLLTSKYEVSESHSSELAIRVEQVQLDDLVTLIYTSGTTGDPKGVMLDYRNFASTISQHDEVLGFTEGDTSLAFLPLSHVFERSWSFYVLARGGKNVYLQDTNRVKQAISTTEPNTLCVVPRFLEKVYSAIQEQVTKGSKVKQLILCLGDEGR